MTPCLRAQLELLQYLNSVWDIDQEKFIIHDQELEIEVSDIYFITRFSRRGDRALMTGNQILGESMGMLIYRACPGARKTQRSGKIDIRIVPELPLRVMLHIITRAVGSQAPHEATKTQI